jgi:hypothetical protein
MSPASYDPKSGVQGPAATLTALGLAIALGVTVFRPTLGLIAGGIGALVAAIIFVGHRKGRLALVGHLGVGLAVGAALAYGLVAIGVLPGIAAP